ncbi:MAG TPA: EAL domain-containing protein [Bryobacteraceae bacterium]
MLLRLVGKFRNSSIRVRLSLLVVLNGSFALAFVGVLLFGYQKFEFHSAAARELSIRAGILADSSTAALGFSDERAAGETLNALRSDPDLMEAAIYDREGHLFAWYEHQPGSSDSELYTGAARPPASPPRRGSYTEDGNLCVSRPVLMRGQLLGTVFLRASTGEVDARLRGYIGILCLVLLVSLSLSLLLSGRMQKAISGPLAQLANVASLVSHEKDYSVRAPARGGGEIGLLIDSFNEMLAQIEIRDRARKGAEESLRESEERFALAARGANDGLWDWKGSTGQIYLSPRGNQMLGYPEIERYLSLDEWFDCVHNSDRARVQDEWDSGIREGKEEFVSEYRMRHRNNTSIWVLSRGKAVKDAKGSIVRIAGSITDITEGKVADALTGLRSRFYFLDRLDQAIEAASRGDAPFAVLFLDLDRFKLVNDSLGHAAGDELLMEIGRRLRLCAQTGGWLESSVIARLGGDEFAVLLNGAREGEAMATAHRFLKHLTSPFRLGGQQLFPGVSIGIALSCSGDNPEDLLRNADTAMYQAKKTGRGRIEIFDEGMRNRAKARLNIEAQLRRAVEANELVLFYQPQVLVAGGEVTGFEALVRWRHPERGLIGPAEFIPIAEETDLIVPLGSWVLHEACRQMAEWQRRFGLAASPTISVNVSYKQLRDPGFVDDVKHVLEDTGLLPGTLRLEMTESAVMTDAEETAIVLWRLKDLKVGLEIDDFGTGYSSLSCLSRLPFDTVKIDRAFVRDLGCHSEGTEIVKAILELARSMTLTVVAEGVESESQLTQLNALGCSHAQGYYFSKPVCASSATVLFENDAFRRGFDRLTRNASEEVEYAAR